MALIWLIIIPLLAGPLAWLSERRGALWPRRVAVIALAADFALGVYLWLSAPPGPAAGAGPLWHAEWTSSWIPRWGITAHLALDGLSLLLIILSGFLGLVAVASSWTEIQEKVGFFHCNLLWVVAGTIGVFLAMDLFLFFVFWEVMLIPMYLLINIWGHENRTYAAIKFFLFTQAGSLLLLVAIVALVWLHFQQTHTLTFEYTALLHTPLSRTMEMLLMLGFFAAFAVKLPAVPVHSWLPDAHTAVSYTHLRPRD